MPYYATHLLVGLLCSLPFYHLDKKNRLRTLIAGMFAGVLPDIDGALQFLPNPSPPYDFFVYHRGFWHWWVLWVLFGLFALFYVFRLYWKQEDFRAFDNSLTFAAVLCAWGSHLFLDFGFMDFHSPAIIVNIPSNLVFMAEMISALLLSLVLAYLLHLRSFREDTLL